MDRVFVDATKAAGGISSRCRSHRTRSGRLTRLTLLAEDGIDWTTNRRGWFSGNMDVRKRIRNIIDGLQKEISAYENQSRHTARPARRSRAPLSPKGLNRSTLTGGKPVPCLGMLYQGQPLLREPLKLGTKPRL